MADSQKRTDYINRIKSNLDDLDAQIDKLEDRGEKIEASIKQDYQEKLAELRQHRQQAQDSLDEIRKAGEQEWHKLQEHLEHTWSAAKNSFNYFTSHFK